MKDKKNIKSTNWLTKDMTQEEIKKIKEDAIREAEADIIDEHVQKIASIICQMFSCDCLKPCGGFCWECKEVAKDILKHYQPKTSENAIIETPTIQSYSTYDNDIVVLTKSEKEKLLHEMYEQGRFDAIADLEKEGKVVISKEEYEDYQDLLKNFDNYLFEYRKFADGYIKDKCRETAEKWNYHITTTLLALWKGNKITTEVYNSWTVFFNSLARQFGCDIEIKEN